MRALFLGVALLAACERSPEVFTAPISQDPIERWCSGLFDAHVARGARCSGTTPEYVRRYLELQHASFTESCSERLANDIAEGRVVFEASAIEACFSEIEAQACVEYEAGVEPASCRAAHQGALEEGAACDGPSDVCAEGLECLGAVRNGWCGYACRKPSPPGGACNDPFDCEGNAACEDHLCVAYPRLGQACEQYCEEGAYCKNERCVPLDGEGEHCARHAQFAFIHSCQPGLTCVQGTCRRFAVAGESCSDWDDNCASFTTCAGGVCAPRALPGDACSGENSCFLGLCQDGRCAELAREPRKKSPGAPCESPDECESGNCLYGHCRALCF